LREQFKGAKQRKLAGCPAGVWPSRSIAVAREQGTPLVLVEGPGDALALAQLPTLTYPVLALVGTANVLPLASFREIAGVVLALDDDESGKKATRQARVDLALAGVPVDVAERGWLQGAKDAGELAQRQAAASDDDGDDADTTLAYAAAGDALMRSGQRLVSAGELTPAAPRDDDRGMLNDVVDSVPLPPMSVETCLWCGTPTPGGVCCDDCAQRNARTV